MQIKKAQRKLSKLKLALTGPTGSGKTMSSIKLAAGLVPGGRIVVIDTEDGSSNLYADHRELAGIEFDVLELDAPYTIKKYIEALEAAQKANFDVIVIDSISHAWAGEGGLLDKKTGLDSRGGNSYTNWASITKEHELFKSRLIHGPTHVIVTMRSKMEYVIQQNDKGKSAPTRVGMAPIQREGMEYEFTTVFDIAADHQFHVSKDRTGLFDGVTGRIEQATGTAIAEWLKGGAVETDVPKSTPSTSSNSSPDTDRTTNGRADTSPIVAAAVNRAPRPEVNDDTVIGWSKAFKGQRLGDCKFDPKFVDMCHWAADKFKDSTKFNDQDMYEDAIAWLEWIDLSSEKGIAVPREPGQEG